MLGMEQRGNDKECCAIIEQFLRQFTGRENGVIYKHDFIQAMLANQELLSILSPFYGID